MRDLFPGWVPPDDGTLSQYWNEATFAVDTSVLLDLYRFSEETRKGLLRALRSFEERLWIPHQVALEFHRNRFGVLLDQREAEGKLLQELDEIQSELDKQLSQRLRGAGRRDLAPLRKAIKSAFDELRSKLQEAEKEHTKGLGESMQDDPIYEEVVTLCEGRVGEAFADETHAEVIADAKERFEGKVPPGYLDADKDEEHRYGDVILWHQLCGKAKETKRPVVLIADDQKTDWVWEVRGKALGPRPELVAEMKSRAGVGFHLYTPSRLLQVWEEREEGRTVGPDVLKEIEDPGSGDAPTTDIDLGGLWRAAANFVGGPPQVAQGPESAGSSQGQTRLEPLSAIVGGYAVLGLNIWLRSESSQISEIHAIVRDPEGNTAGTITTPNKALRQGLVQPVMLWYPSDFDSAGSLQPGEYVVSWSVFLQRSKTEIDHAAVHDTFFIPGD